ncbi:Ras family protein [Tritrichomonas foetus]|uniref:Ras family protein n=1 Tax=Tritrichomonas foetus TaxID=1144522 RepID=A0A1J4JKY1_9EUKA|nr:Ras family protein [Tritrichomonas foetus]|eukprot:OHS98221.1 Ras family protein [Tritrichomonas foetus]
MATEPDFRFKICVIGSSGCGKTAMVDQLISGKFNENTKPTVGVSYRPYQFSINDYIVHLELWDTAGQEKYKAVAKTYFRNAVGCALVFDTTDQQSFDELSFWIQQFRQLADPNAMILLVGNKIDLTDKRQIQSDIAEKFASDNLIVYVETSALTGHNIKETFQRIAHGLFDLVKSGKLVNKRAQAASESIKDKREATIADVTNDVPFIKNCLC